MWLSNVSTIYGKVCHFPIDLQYQLWSNIKDLCTWGSVSGISIQLHGSVHLTLC